MCTLLLCFDIDFCSIKLLKWNRNCSLSEKEYKIFNIGPDDEKVYYVMNETSKTDCEFYFCRKAKSFMMYTPLGDVLFTKGF